MTANAPKLKMNLDIDFLHAGGPLIFWLTPTGVKINRWFFYIFYPAHLALIVLLKYLVSMA